MNRPSVLVLSLAVALLVAPGTTSLSSAQDAPAAHASKMKALQLRLLRNEPLERRAELREHARRVREARRHPGRAILKGERLRAERNEPAQSLVELKVASPADRVATRSGVAAFPPANVRVNDPTGDANIPPNAQAAGQAEQSIAADGNNVLVAWNDGQGFVSGGDTQGYGYSIDGGQTFVDGGVPPKGATWTWTSDPLVAVNERTHEFFFCALINIGATQNGIGIVKGTFSGGAVVWGTPAVVVSGSNSTSLYDKPWIAVDTSTVASAAILVAYTKFTLSGDQIEVARSTTAGASWSGATVLSSPSENGFVQGARVVANNGTAYAMWYSIGPIDVDFYRVRKSLNGGTTWGAAVDAVSSFQNFGSGAPGFNRGSSINFAGMALNRSSQHNPNRLYITWSESVDFYADAIGGAGTKVEVEGNDTPGTATPFTVGQTLRGTFPLTSDFDWWSFTGTQGQTLIAFVDSVNTSVDGFLRVFCTDGVERLALSAPGAGTSATDTIGSLVVFTLPATGTYYLRYVPAAGTGNYRIRTGFHTPLPAADRARDHRDVFTRHSDDGTTWTAAPVMVNDDPAGLDNWLPEIAVDGGGIAYTLWYDWRDSPPSKCGGVSNTYLAYSEDGGSSWVQRGTVSDAPTDWTPVLSNIAPNQGDYLGLYANATDIYPAWADGRNTGTGPDVYTVRLPIATTPALASLVSATAEPGRVRVRWSVSGTSGPAQVYRNASGGAWMPVASISPDGVGYVDYLDTDVVAGVRYGYRLGLHEAGGPEVFAGETYVVVPAALDLAIGGVHPNPAERDLWVTFALPAGGPARLEMLDVAGRVVRVREVGDLGPGSHTVNLAEGERLPAGLYVVRLSRDGRSVTTRVSVVR